MIDNLTSNAGVYGASGTTDFLAPPISPYVNSSGNLGPGQKVSITLEFTNPSKGYIGYTTRVLAGPGPR